MLNRFRSSHKRLVLGIQFDGHETALVQVGAALAKRTGMTLRLIHAIEPIPVTYSGYPEGYWSTGLAYSRERALLHEAKLSLERLAQDKDFGIKVETKAMVGQAAEVLMADARSSGASLLVCGAKHVSHRFVPRGFSTALSLMADASIPVLVLPEGNESDFSKHVLTLMMGDDLSEGSREALYTACEIAYGLGQAKLTHFHLHRQSRSEMERWAIWASEAMIAQELENMPTGLLDNYASAAEERIKGQLEKRIGTLRSHLEEGGVSYEQVVLFGDIYDQLMWLVEHKQPDLVVFGKHHFLHRRPWAIGRMPSYVMLSLNCPIMTVAATRAG